jgi:hypothetical protein
MRVTFAVFLFIHAAAHVVGFITVSGIAQIEDTSGRATFLVDRLEPGHWVMRVLAVFWLLATGAFVASGIGVLGDATWAAPVILMSTVLSLVLCLIWAKETPFGLLANGVVLVVLMIPALSERMVPPT